MSRPNHKLRLRAKLPGKKDQTVAKNHMALIRMKPDGLLRLQEYLQERLKDGRNRRDERLPRMFRIDRLISTWRKHTEEDTKRLEKEEATGRQTAVAGNLPLMAAHLEDITAFYADTLAPQANPFISTATDVAVQEMIKRLGKDVQARNYYGEVASAARALIKYNVGGVAVHWDSGSPSTTSLHGIQGAGNSYKALPMHNTMWDSAIKNPRHVAAQAEWGAYIEVTNRATLIRRAARGEIYDIERFLDSETSAISPQGRPMGGGLKLWIDPSHSIPTSDGSDALSGYSALEKINWEELGLSIPEDASSLNDCQFERTHMWCWIVPHEFGLLTTDDKATLQESGLDFESYVELWRFELINNFHIIKAEPHAPRTRVLKGESPMIPMYMSHLIEDELGDSQRAQMELIAGFQRMASSIFEIGINALRKDVWGHTFVDGQMFDATKIESGNSVGVHTSKQPGRDVRSGIQMVAGSNGASQAFGHVDTIMGLKNNLFPSQALPAQVAGLDRAVTNQVTAVVHGAQRGLRMSLRLVDQSIFLPARLETARNLSRFEPLAAANTEIDDETLAKQLGSGIESLESERITEALWRLLMSIVQNQEAMQTFDVSKIMMYLAQVLRINEDFSTFVRQAPQQPPGGEAGVGGQGGGEPPPEGQQQQPPIQ